MLISNRGTDMASRSFLAATCLLLTTACGSAPEPEQGKIAGDRSGIGAAATGAAPTLRLKPGRWKQAGVLAKAAGPAESRCVSPEEALTTANGSDEQIRSALAAQAAKDGCKMGTVTINGPTIAWTQTCSGAALSMSSEYRGDSSTTTISGGGMPTMTTQSLRIGDC